MRTKLIEYADNKNICIYVIVCGFGSEYEKCTMSCENAMIREKIYKKE